VAGTFGLERSSQEAMELRRMYVTPKHARVFVTIEARDPTLATVVHDARYYAPEHLRFATIELGYGRERIGADRESTGEPTSSNPATQPGPRRERIGARRRSTGGNGRGSTDGNVRIIARRFTPG
jgi:hypothetical protein